MTVRRNGGNLLEEGVARRGVGDLLAVDLDRTALGLDDVGDGVHQLLLAVAVDACDTHDLARMDVEVEAAHLLDATFVLDGEVADREDRLARMGGGLLDREVDVTTDHLRGQLGLVGLVDVDRTHVDAATDDRALVGGLHDLLQLMRDNDDRLALGNEVMHDLDELLDLLRGKDGRGLVQNQHLGTAVEGLEDLDALLHAHRDVLDLCVGVDIETVLLDELHDLLARTGHIENARCTANLIAKDDVLGHGEVLDQHEVLVHHANAMLDGLGRIGNADLLAVHEDVALICLV